MRSISVDKCRHPRAQRRHRKGLAQTIVNVGCGRRLDIGERGGHGARHIGFGPAAQRRRHQRDVAERHRRLYAQGDTAGAHDKLQSSYGSLLNAPNLFKFHRYRLGAAGLDRRCIVTPR